MAASAKVPYETPGEWVSIATGPCDVVLHCNTNFVFVWDEAEPSASIPGFPQRSEWPPLNVPVLAGEDLYVRAPTAAVFTRMVDEEA